MDKKGPIPEGMIQMMFFFKCFDKKKIAGCMKKDFRSEPQKFQLQGLDGVLDSFLEPDEQMLKVVKMFFKFGDDELAFFTH